MAETATQMDKFIQVTTTKRRGGHSVVSIFAEVIKGERDSLPQAQILLERTLDALRELRDTDFIVVFFDANTPLVTHLPNSASLLTVVLISVALQIDLAAGRQLSIKWLWKKFEA